MKFTEIFDQKRYDDFKQGLQGFLQSQYGHLQALEVGLYLFIFAVALLVDVCGVSSEWLSQILLKLYRGKEPYKQKKEYVH